MPICMHMLRCTCMNHNRKQLTMTLPARQLTELYLFAYRIGGWWLIFYWIKETNRVSYFRGSKACFEFCSLHLTYTCTSMIIMPNSIIISDVSIYEIIHMNCGYRWKWRIIISLVELFQYILTSFHPHVNFPVRIPLKPWFFFRLLLSSCLNWKIHCEDHSSLSSITAVHMNYFIYTYIIPPSREDMNSTNWPRSQCVAS